MSGPTRFDQPSAWSTMLRACVDDPGVAGVILHGSRSFEGCARPDSDYDVVVVADAPRSLPRAWEASAEMDVWEVPLDRWPRHAMPGEPDAWNRYALVHSKLLYERPGSGVQAQLDRKRRLSADEARELSRGALDEYINGCYRSLKNHRDERTLEAMIDAAESVSPLLVAVFALHHRVRPYNRYLRWELAHRPLADGALTADTLVSSIQSSDCERRSSCSARNLRPYRAGGARQRSWRRHRLLAREARPAGTWSLTRRSVHSSPCTSVSPSSCGSAKLASNSLSDASSIGNAALASKRLARSAGADEAGCG